MKFQFLDGASADDLGVRIIWRCNMCGQEREEFADYNEGGQCDCGGQWMRVGESYDC